MRSQKKNALASPSLPFIILPLVVALVGLGEVVGAEEATEAPGRVEDGKEGEEGEEGREVGVGRLRRL